MAPPEEQQRQELLAKLEQRLATRIKQTACLRHIKTEFEQICTQLNTCTKRASEGIRSLPGAHLSSSPLSFLHHTLGSYQENVSEITPTLRYADLHDHLGVIRGSALLDLVEQLETGEDALKKSLAVTFETVRIWRIAIDILPGGCSSEQQAAPLIELDMDALEVHMAEVAKHESLVSDGMEDSKRRLQDAVRCFTMRADALQLDVNSAKACDPQWPTRSNREREQVVKKKMRWATDPRNPEMLHEAGHQDQWELIRQLELYDINADALKKIQDRRDRLQKAIGSLAELKIMQG